MKCPRLKHFVRLDPTGKIGKCGHMSGAKVFDSIEQMQESVWLKEIEKSMANGEWPAECVRCEMTEKTSGSSIRLDMIERDRILKSINKNYLIVGGVLDNICNSACQSCNPNLSTKIGSLESRDYIKINNYKQFLNLPLERIVELDVNGGEPTASPNYKKLLKNLPNSVHIVRLNTNGSKIIDNIVQLLQKGIRVIVTLSFDGVSDVHDYVRWPIKWTQYQKNVKEYLKLREQYKNLRLNTWTTLSCLNVLNFDQILKFADDNQLDHSYGFCIRPAVLDIRYKNLFTIQAKEKFKDSKNKLLKSISEKCGSITNNSKDLQTFISHQDKIRNINFKDYFNFNLNLL